MVEKNKIVGITGIDTRSLTNFIRDKGRRERYLFTTKKIKYKKTY